jgi:hypothetical protein
MPPTESEAHSLSRTSALVAPTEELLLFGRALLRLLDGEITAHEYA